MIMIIEDSRSMGGRLLGRWNSSSRFGVLARNDNCILFTLCLFGSSSHNTHCDEVEWSRHWEELQSKLW